MDGSDHDISARAHPAREPFQLVELGIGGMTCNDCVGTVAEALESVPGVSEAEVDLGRRSARVTAQPSVEPDRLANAVRASGYNAFVRSREPGPAA
jgi:Cu+-exporting ATPase